MRFRSENHTITDAFSFLLLGVFAVAANTDNVSTVTASANISFLTGAKGNRLTAEANRIREGVTSCLYEVKVFDEEGTMVAFVTVQGARLS